MNLLELLRRWFGKTKAEFPPIAQAPFEERRAAPTLVPAPSQQDEPKRIAKAGWEGLWPIPTVQVEIDGKREIRVDDRGVLRPLNEVERAVIARGEELREQ